MNKDNNRHSTGCEFKRHSLATAIAGVYLSLALVPVYASDTEVYVQTTSTSTSAASPALMFMIDGTSRMKRCLATDDDCTSPNRRIDALFEGLTTALKGDANANPAILPAPGYLKVGFGSNGYDGQNVPPWIRYPARPLDAFVSVNPDGVLTSPVAQGADDAVLSTPNNITADLNISNPSAPIGLRFDRLLVPKGATVTSAKIVLTKKSGTLSASNQVTLALENSTDALDFSTSTVRTYQPDSVVTPVIDSTTYSIDVTSSINALVNDSTWCGGNAAAFKLTSNAVGTVTVHRFESATTANNLDYVPQLLVTFSVSPTKADSCTVASKTALFELVPIGDSTQASINDVEWVEGSIDTKPAANVLSFNTITQTTNTVPSGTSTTTTGSDVKTSLTTSCYSSAGAAATANDKGTLSCPTNTSTTTYGTCTYTWNTPTSACAGGKKKYTAKQTVPFTTVTPGTTTTYVYTKAAVGLRFPNVTIAKDANITSAILTIKPNQNATQPTNVVAFLPDSGNMPKFCESTTACTATPAPTAANLPAGSPGLSSKVVKTVTTADPTFNVKDLIQVVVGQTNWASGNALALRLRSDATVDPTSATNPTDGINAIASDQTAVRSNWPTLSVTWDEKITDLSGLKTVRQDILDELAKMKAETDGALRSGKSPLGNSIIEGARYLMGLTPTPGAQYAAAAYDPDTLKYISPITASADTACGGNTVFVLSDGHPDTNAGTNNATSDLDSHLACTDFATDTAGSGTSNLQYKCLMTVANYLQNNSPNAPNTPGTIHYRNPLNTKIKVVAAQFGPIFPEGYIPQNNNEQQSMYDADNLEKLAVKYGGGEYYPASTKASLVDAFLKVVNKMRNDGNAIAAPGVAVNQLNRLNHLDQLYYAVFEPKRGAYHWEGNLKRYQISGTGATIQDAHKPPRDAVDVTTGFFLKDAKSFWSVADDGDLAIEGGAASVLPLPASRTMYTYSGSDSDKDVLLTTIPTNFAANTAFNTWAKGQIALTDDASSNKYVNLMNWYRGYTVPRIDTGLVDASTASPRKRLGAALHSQPVLINYGFTIPTGGEAVDAAKPENQANYVFFSTMEGSLHVINAKDGSEKFSFIPAEKLSILDDLQGNNLSSPLPAFGMDLTWTYSRKDVNGDGQIGAGDQVYIYGGMRMGGSSYYGLDVSDLDSPRLLFTIKGGAGGTTGFANMGQTWSQPVVSKIKVAGVVRNVLMFGGGYDMRHEISPSAFPTNNDVGNQLYIVDAVTGELLWSASGTSGATKTVADMKYSVVTQPRIIDVDGDTLADIVYFGDLGGQVFRADLNKNAASTATIAKRVRLIAKLGQTAMATPNELNRRRFYEAPEVALFKDVNGTHFVAVAFGSGYRSHPLDQTMQERFYVLFDYDAPKKGLADLAENDASLQVVITDTNLATLSLTSATGANVTNKLGWYVNLPDSGEKSMASAFIFKSRLIFSTYVPTVVGTPSCTSPVIGRSKLYSMCMPYGDICDAGITTRVTDNVTMGIAGEPQFLLIKNPDTGEVTKVLVTGTNINDDILRPTGIDAAGLKPIHRWHEKTRNPAN